MVEECDGQQEKLETCLISLSVGSLKTNAEKYGQYPDAFSDEIDSSWHA